MFMCTREHAILLYQCEAQPLQQAIKQCFESKMVF